MDDYGEFDNGHDMAGIIIDDYDEYDEEYFEDGGHFSGVVSCNAVEPDASASLSRAERLSRGDGSRPPSQGCTSNNRYDKTGNDIVEEVEEFIEEVEEEEVDDDDPDVVGERYNRTQVSDARVSVLDRLGPKLETNASPVSAPSASPLPTPATRCIPSSAIAATTATAPPLTAGDTSTATSLQLDNVDGSLKPAKRARHLTKAQLSQYKNVYKKLIYIANIPSACTDLRMREVIESKLKGHVALEVFDGIYGGCCLALLSSFSAVSAVLGQLSYTTIAGSKIFARVMTFKDHTSFMNHKMACSMASVDFLPNSKWIVALLNIPNDCSENWLLKTLREEMSSIIFLQYYKSRDESGVEIVALVFLESKEDADLFVKVNHERMLNDNKVLACPYYRGYNAAAINATKGNPLRSPSQPATQPATVVSGSPEKVTPDAEVKPGPSALSTAVSKLNSLHELHQKTKGANHRVFAHNIAYAVTEDEMIKAVNAKVGGLQYILPFRNNQGCFNGNMLLEFYTPVAAKKFHSTMQRFMLKSRPMFLKMDTDAARDLQGNVIQGARQASSSIATTQQKDAMKPVERRIASTAEPTVSHGTVPIEPLLGARLEPMLHSPLTDPSAEIFGFTREYLKQLNISLPLVPQVILSNVDPRATENAVGDFLSFVGAVRTVQNNRTLEQSIVEMSHPTEAVEAIAKLHGQIFYQRQIVVRMLRQYDFERFHGLPVADGDIASISAASVMNTQQPQQLRDFRPSVVRPNDSPNNDDLRNRLSRPGSRGNADITSTSAGRGGPGAIAGNDRVAKSGVPTDAIGLKSEGKSDTFEGVPFLGRSKGLGFSSSPLSVLANKSVSISKESELPRDLIKESSSSTPAAIENKSIPDKKLIQPGSIQPAQADSKSAKPEIESSNEPCQKISESSSASSVTASLVSSTNNLPSCSSATIAPVTRNAGMTAVMGRGSTVINVGRGTIANSAGRGVATNALASSGSLINTVGRGVPVNAPSGRGASTSFIAGRGTSANSVAGRGAPASAVAHRGAPAMALAGRGATIAPVGRGAATNVPRGFCATTTAPGGRSAEPNAPSEKEPATNIPAGRGRGTPVNAPAGRGAASNVVAGRGKTSNVAEEIKAATSVTDGKGGAAANVAVERRGATSVAVGKVGTTIVTMGRDEAMNVLTRTGEETSVSVGRSEETNVAVGRGRISKLAVGREEAARVTVERGSSPHVTIEKAATANLASESGNATKVMTESGGSTCLFVERGVLTNALRRGAETKVSVERGASSNVSVGRGAETKVSVERGVSSNVSVGRGAEINVSVQRGVSSNVSVGRGAETNFGTSVGRTTVVGVVGRKDETLKPEETNADKVELSSSERKESMLSDQKCIIVADENSVDRKSDCFHAKSLAASKQSSITDNVKIENLNISGLNKSNLDKLPVSNLTHSKSNLESLPYTGSVVPSEIIIASESGSSNIFGDATKDKDKFSDIKCDVQKLEVHCVGSSTQYQDRYKSEDQASGEKQNTSKEFSSSASYKESGNSSADGTKGTWRTGNTVTKDSVPVEERDSGCPMQKAEPANEESVQSLKVDLGNIWDEAETQKGTYSNDGYTGRSQYFDHSATNTFGSKRPRPDSSQNATQESEADNKRFKSGTASYEQQDVGRAEKEVFPGSSSENNPYLRPCNQSGDGDASSSNGTTWKSATPNLPTKDTFESSGNYGAPQYGFQTRSEIEGNAQYRSDNPYNKSFADDKPYTSSERLRYQNDPRENNYRTDNWRTGMFNPRNEFPTYDDRRQGRSTAESFGTKYERRDGSTAMPDIDKSASDYNSRYTYYGNTQQSRDNRSAQQKRWSDYNVCGGERPMETSYGRNLAREKTGFGTERDPYLANASMNSGTSNFLSTKDRFYGGANESNLGYSTPSGGFFGSRNSYEASSNRSYLYSRSETSFFSTNASSKLIINNLPSYVRERDIMELCSVYGLVRNIDIDAREMKCRVLFDSPREANMAARDLDDRVYRGSTLRALVA